MYRIFEGGILKPIIVEAWGDDEFGKDIIDNFDRIVSIREKAERSLFVSMYIPNQKRNELICKFHKVAVNKYNLSTYYVAKMMSLFFPITLDGVIRIIKRNN